MDEDISQHCKSNPKTKCGANGTRNKSAVRQLEGCHSTTTNHAKNSLKFEVESSLHFLCYGMGAQLTAEPACVQKETIQPCRRLE